ncbi:PAS domain S-box protein [Spirochaeta lutea]|uniref:Histidine kinase n=1 Tax=Spirochaeta lutea TaxID=1480694 RepID=A0A098QV11_9SPIO|nr:PAS domain S-box protein [Spirochaeta lutea]KGE71574.1 hypothetical protein DC28_09800 [Spirochaeta lutea]
MKDIYSKSSHTNDEPTIQEMAKNLAESKAHTQALLQASFGGIAIHDKGIILECNAALETLFGYSRSHLIGMDGLELIVPSERPRVRDIIASGFDKPYESLGLTVRGTVFPVRIEAKNIPYHGRQVRVTEFRDITDQKQAQEALQQSEEKFRSLFENNHAVILVIDPRDGSIFDANPAAARFYGWSEDELRTMNIDQINTLSRDEIETEMARAAADKNNYFVFEHRRKTGGACPVEVYSGPIRIGGRKLLYSLVHDISKRREVEEALETSAIRNKELLRELQHRAKNSFSLIASLIDLTAGKSVNPEALKILEDLGSRVRSMSELYSLLYSRDQVDQVRLDEYLHRLVHPIIDLTPGITKKCLLEPVTVPTSIAAPLGLIVTELMTNAIKHAFPEGTGNISIVLKGDSHGDSTGQYSGATLEIADNGCGMPEDLASRGCGFDTPQASLPTPGLGIQLIQSLVLQIRGTIETTCRGGTITTITVPLD